jgi:hypothetical protein
VHLVYSTNKNDNNLDLYYFICLFQSKLINLIMDNLNHQVKKIIVLQKKRRRREDLNKKTHLTHNIRLFSNKC